MKKLYYSITMTVFPIFWKIYMLIYTQEIYVLVVPT